MRSVLLLLVCVLICLAPIGCVDLLDQNLRGTVDVIVVDGTINNLAEPQLIRLNRSKADPLTGRFGSLPITKAKVEVIVDASQVISCHETDDGTYQLPSDFKGEVGHTYQLRFQLVDGTQYESVPETMPRGVPIDRVFHKFNSNSLPPKRPDGQASLVIAASDIFIDWHDPVSEHNYYRWDWKLWERQEWCRSCGKGYYLIWNYYESDQLFEDCYSVSMLPPRDGAIYGPSALYFVNDYRCRMECWEILYNYDINVFDDALSNGGQLTGRRVAQIPYYQKHGCLVEIRQSSLTRPAYEYVKQLQQQAENTGGLADTPPTAIVGNVHNVANDQEGVVGYFSAAPVSAKRYWLDRQDATGTPPGLFYGLRGILPSPEDATVDPNTEIGKPSPGIGGKNADRPPTAICVPSDSRTPFKPEGWR
jgi:hypothetical protein